MKRKFLTTTRIIMLGFFLGSLIGAGLLSLPISQKPGVNLSFLDALFVATSSICVTGLSTVNIGLTFSGFGQVVLLLLIQMGGLGVVTFTTLLLLAVGKRLTLTDRLLIQNAYNLDTLSGLVRLTFQIVKVTFIIELIGAVAYGFVFIPEYGAKGIWYSLFHAVSAFCNAGIDLLGGNSFCKYRDDLIINATTFFLVVSGGLGFPVYWEIARFLKRKKDVRRKMSFHAKVVLISTAVLLIAGTFITLIFEYNNPDTLGTLSFGQKIQASVFQSMTLRTAGFATIDQGYFTSATCAVYLIFMFIGGSPAGTAGGVKTVTMTLLWASVIANLRGKKDVSIMNRKVTDATIRRCVAIICFSFVVLGCLTTVLLLVQPGDYMDVVYEMTSAIATVGLSRGLTGSLQPLAKLIVALTMYLGRIGPISIALAFNSNKYDGAVSHAEAKVIIG